MNERVAMLHGDTVYRVHWKLGTDVLVGVCHCGAEHESEDPVEMWEWLLAHPDGHQPGGPFGGGAAHDASPNAWQPVGVGVWPETDSCAWA